jgi:hypothetical protein
MELTNENMKFPPDYEDKRPQTEEATPFEDSKEPHCPSCKERWIFDECASTSVSIAMHCEQPWVVLFCPKCKDGFMVTASGKSHSTIEEEAILSMHVAQYWIAKVKK